MAALLAMTSQPASLNPLVVAATHQVLKVELLPWELTAVLHQGPRGTEAPLDMISTEVSLLEGEGEEGEAVEDTAEMILDTAEEAVVEEDMEEVEAGAMEVAATIGRVEAGVMVAVEGEVWRRFSQTTRYLSRVFLLTPLRRTSLSSLALSV